MKSIEALHDEALSLARDTASNHSNNAPSAVLNAATPRQESPADAPSDTSENAPSETSGDHDIMVRIDHLLKKLDEDVDVAIAPPADEGQQSSTGDMTGNAIGTATADNIAIDNPADPESPILSNASDHANENAIIDVVEDTAGKPLVKTGDDASDDMFVGSQSGKTVPSDQAQALADIAAAIYQAGQQAVDTVVTDANQNNSVPVDMDILSATVANEVRRTLSAMMIAELPQMVRDAVSEAIHSLPADVRGQSTPTTVNPSPTKTVTMHKTIATKKAVAKTASTKKAAAKKARAKKAHTKKRPGQKATVKTAQ